MIGILLLLLGGQLAEGVEDTHPLIGEWVIDWEMSLPRLDKKIEALKDPPEKKAKIREEMIEIHQRYGFVFSKDKFTTHMASADDYMQQGRYYRAAEAYTLAALYKPRDVRPQLGKGHALFAAGEYLSSAIYIAKALEAAPPGTLTQPADLVRAVGGPSPFEARLTDLARCAQASEAPELKFLLAYVYLRTGDAARAKAALTLTAEHFRAWPPARILRQAIHEATLAPYLK